MVAVGWPVIPSGFAGIEVFLQGEVQEKEMLRNEVATVLPEYMIPRRFHFMSKLPHNANEKFDRQALLRLLEQGL